MRIGNAQNKWKRRVEPHRNSLSYFTGIALAISRSENRAFYLFKVVSICNR